MKDIDVIIRGPSGSGRSAIAGLIMDALSNANMVANIVNTDTGLKLSDVEYVRRAKTIDALATCQVNIRLIQETDRESFD